MTRTLSASSRAIASAADCLGGSSNTQKPANTRSRSSSVVACSWPPAACRQATARQRRPRAALSSSIDPSCRRATSSSGAVVSPSSSTAGRASEYLLRRALDHQKRGDRGGRPAARRSRRSKSNGTSPTWCHSGNGRCSRASQNGVVERALHPAFEPAVHGRELEHARRISAPLTPG